jgi:hypothetical protein
LAYFNTSLVLTDPFLVLCRPARLQTRSHSTRVTEETEENK